MITRRVMLQLATGLGVSLGLPLAAGAANPPAHWMATGLRQTLVAFFDTLVPDAGIGTDMDTRLAGLDVESERKRLVDVCEWLDAAARRVGADSFALLDEARRNAVLQEASVLDPSSPMRRFFDSTRRLVFTLHYGKAGSWPAVGYAGPPQPIGFPDYARPPRSGSSS